MPTSMRLAFTLVELLCVLAIIAVLLCVFFPSTRGARDAARRMSCSNNFKQLGLAIHNYHSAYKQLPMTLGGTASNQHRLSGLVGLVPFLEQQALWQEISNPSKYGSAAFPAMGPEPWTEEYAPWRTQIPNLRCPSDPGEKRKFGLSNYALCVGDQLHDIHKTKMARGVFACGLTTRFRDITDGLSSTIAGGEIETDLEDFGIGGTFAINQPPSTLKSQPDFGFLTDPDRPQFFRSQVDVDGEGRGGRWADGAAGYTLFNTIAPPNSASYSVGREAADGIYSAASRHAGGAHVLMADGAVIFITDSIECGSTGANTSDDDSPRDSLASRYGLWGALGSAAGGEDTEEQRNQ